MRILKIKQDELESSQKLNVYILTKIFYAKNFLIKYVYVYFDKILNFNICGWHTIDKLKISKIVSIFHREY